MMEGAVCGGIAASSSVPWVTTGKGAEVSGQHRHESAISETGPPGPLGPSVLANLGVMAP